MGLTESRESANAQGDAQEGITEDPTTPSAVLRKKGNEFLAQSNDESLSSCIRKYRLKDAIKLYGKSLEASVSPFDVCSVHKNLAVVSRKLALMINDTEQIKESHHFFAEALKHFDATLKFSSEVKSKKWREDIQTSFKETKNEVLESIKDLKPDDRIKALEMYAAVFKNEQEIKAEILIEMVKQRFQEGIRYNQEKDYKRCLNMMNECHRPLEEARRLGIDNKYVQSEVRIYTKDTFIYTCISQASQAKVLADELFEQCLKGEESLNLNGIWRVVDLYKEAILLTRENDLEIEAMALSGMGKVYDQILKNAPKAKRCFKRAVQLAISLQPRTFDSEEWFKLCEETLLRYQEEAVKQETDLWNTERIPLAKELEPEITRLNEAYSKGAIDYLKHVYTTHKPKGRKKRHPNFDAHQKLAEEAEKSAALKKMLKHALVHYHPDRVDVKLHGNKWKVMCEEITKLCTVFYEYLK